ncbi:hypothetical protein VSS74_02005 [Conexibacter stalactiti]|uniref:Uncharacterized protein n=1 Tax=Conexibacter stalactiti TaxID=1940611 RepID=A0ABU4HIF1_9ACTN|nr:hypothetical protein [Conexibacter stalactiti]MDW5593093.1 hypothetical protein [Conexibacter stalactiti]MEC5033734.1 hypothetical protein [Conexibacter stalactiti]
MAAALVLRGDVEALCKRGEALVLRPQHRVRGEPGGSQELGVDVANAVAVESAVGDQTKDLVVLGDDRLGEVAQQAEDLVAVAEVGEREFADDARVREDGAVVEQAGERVVAVTEEVDPDGGIDEDHCGSLRRRRTSSSAGSLPPRRARRRALSRSISAPSASRTSAVFSVVPVRR